MDKLTPLIYYPTTTVFVDDNWAFLQSFSLLLAEEFTFRPFDSAREALNCINASPAPLGERLAHGDDAVNSYDPGNTESILFSREIINRQKYEEVSVVVVDYTMPHMNGLDFCKQIDNPQVKKVLFSGQADESIAIRAMDQGIIDACVLKSASKVTKKIITTVAQLKHDYFSAASASVQLLPNETIGDFVSDPAFQELFDSLLESSQYVEYYYQTNPPGYLLFTQTGVCNRLVVYSQEFIAQFIEQHKETLPGAIAKATATGQVIPYFPPRESPASGDNNFRWQTYLYPAKSFQGDKVYYYYYALIDNPKLQMLTNHAPPTYAAYLEEFDQQLFS